MDTKTLKMITESIIMQIKPEITDDQNISESWIDDMVDDSRAAMVRVLYNANDQFQDWHQKIDLEAISDNKIVINEHDYYFKEPLMKITLPGLLMQDMGWKNIAYFGSHGFNSANYERVGMQEFQEYKYHRFGNTKPCYLVSGNCIYIKNAEIQKYYSALICFSKPSCVPGFNRESSVYPLPVSLHRKLEIITFQHIAPKLNLPVDIISNHTDDTKNGNMSDAVRQSTKEITE